jgi:hypothetical protein
MRFSGKRLKSKKSKVFRELKEKLAEETFKAEVFDSIFDNVIPCGIETRFRSIWEVHDKFGVLLNFHESCWIYIKMI